MMEVLDYFHILIPKEAKGLDQAKGLEHSFYLLDHGNMGDDR